MNDISFNLEKFRNLIDDFGGVSKVAEDIGLDKSLVNRHYNGDKNRPLTATYIGKYCKYFNVSPDFLFGLTDVECHDKTLRFVCEYTGLTEFAAENLHYMNDRAKEKNAEKEEKYNIIFDSINKILSDDFPLLDLAFSVSRYKDSSLELKKEIETFFNEIEESENNLEISENFKVTKHIEHDMILHHAKYLKYQRYEIQEEIENILSPVFYKSTKDVNNLIEKIKKFDMHRFLFEDGEPNGNNTET